MNETILRSLKLTATPQNEGASYAHEFKPNEQELLLRKGQLLALITLDKQSEPLLVRDTLEKIQTAYFESPEASTLRALKTSLRGVTAQVIVLVCVENFIYVAIAGQGQLWLYRRGELIKLLEGQAQKLTAISGKAQEGDTLVLGTQEFFKGIAQGILKASVGQANLDSTAEILASAITSMSNPQAGCIITRFEHRKEVVGPLVKRQTSPQIKRFLQSTLLRAVDWVLAILPQKSIKVSESQFLTTTRPQKKSTVAIGLVLMVILAISIGAGIKRRESVAQKNHYEGRLAEVRRNVDEALTLNDLNKDRARALLLNSYELALELEADSLKDAAFDQLKSEIESKLGAVAGIYKQQAQPFLDLSLITSNFKGDTLASSGDNMLVLDKNGKKLVAIGIDSKRTEIIAGPAEISEARDAALYVDREFILTDGGVEEILATPQVIVTKDWSVNSLLRVYAGNVYILDKTDAKIYRFQAAGRGFGSRNDWLAEGTSLNLGDTKAWAIDGLMWLLGEDNKLTKLIGGREDFVAFTADLEAELVDLYTDEESDYLYFLDAKNSKIWVYDKAGKFKAEYQVPQAGEASKLVVSESLKKLILLAESKLYSVELKHLGGDGGN